MTVRLRRCLLALTLLPVLLPVAACDRALAFAAPEMAPVAAAPLEILPSGHPVVEVRLDGSAPRRFVIDTAASTTTILPQLRAVMPALVATQADSPLNGASGAVDVELAPIELLETGGHSFHGRELLLLPPGPVDMLGVDGILGADLIADYAVEMDMPGRKWKMLPRADDAMRAGFSASVPFTLDSQRAPRLTIRVNGKDVPAVLDTGARGTIINWAAARAIGITPDDPRLAKGTDVKGASRHATASFKVVLDELAIGAAVIAGREVRIADLPVFEMLGYAKGEPAVILGIDYFADRRILIDHPQLRLHVSQAAQSLEPLAE